MDLTFSDSEAAFRDELRAWFESNDPGPVPEGEDAGYAFRRDWQRRLAEDRYAAVHWPQEYGGRGASITESAIFFEELGRARAPLPANVLGILLAGPTIMTFGTPEQKERYLPPILTAEEIWCQGFSEPDAGSDLASLRPLFETSVGSSVAISYEFGPGNCMIFADPAQLESALLNLVINARDAMPSGGQIRISAQVVRDPAQRGAGGAVDAGTD